MHNDNKSLTESQEEAVLICQEARNNLLTFSQCVDKTYIANWHHYLIAKKLEEAYEKIQRGEKVRLMINLPPRAGKSRLATQLFPAWVLGKSPELEFMVTSYSADLASKFGLATKDVMTNEKYQAIFPDVRLRKDSKSKADWKVKQGGSYHAVGVGGSLTGMGANCAIIDDPLKNREEAESKLIRDKIYDWYTSTLYTRLQGYGAVIVILTRWHDDDLAGKLLYEDEQRRERGEQTEDWEVLKFPALATEDEDWGEGIRRKEGEALWPWRFPKDKMLQTKDTVGLYDWAALYQQDPVLAETQEFKADMFQYYTDADLKDKQLQYYTMVDPAISQKESADNTVVLTVGKDRNGPNWYRIKEDAGHFTPGQTVDVIFKHQQTYRSEVWLETVAYQKALKYSIEEEQRRRQTYFKVEEVKTGTNKEMRIRGLIPLYEAGVIYHRHTDKEYELELLTFPRGRRDDRIDAMAMALDAVKNTKYNRQAKTKVPLWNGYGRLRRK
jgi:predicted phage terminase large subunit-like protein